MSCILALLLWIVAPTQPGFPLPAGQETEPETATITGIVTRLGTGEVLSRAVIQVIPAAAPAAAPTARSEAVRLTATSDTLGRFRIEEVPPGQYRMTVHRNGFVRHELGQRDPDGPGTPFEVQAREEMEVSVEMLPAAILTGRVYDEVGEPVPGASVAALRAVYDAQGGRRLAPAASGSTDDRGEYRLFWLSPDDYYLQAVAGRNPVMGILGNGAVLNSTAGPNVAPLLEGRMAAFFPSVADESEATPIPVRAGDQLAGLDIRLRSSTTFRVTGRITGNVPAAVLGSILVTLTPQSLTTLSLAAGLSAGRPDPDGNFEIADVTPGAYRLRATATVAGRRLQGVVPVEVLNSDLENVVLPLQAGVSFPGRIFIEEAASPGAATVVDQIDWTRLRLMLMSDDLLTGSSGQPGAGQGEMLFRDVFPGEYRVQDPFLSGLYLKRIRFNGSEASVDDPILVGPTVEEGLDVLLSPNGGRVSGRVVDADGNPMAGALVVLVDERVLSAATLPSPINRGPARADAGGAFSVTGLAPGSYLAFAWETLPQSVLDPNFLRRFRNRAERVSVAEGDGLSLNLEVIGSEEVRP